MDNVASSDCSSADDLLDEIPKDGPSRVNQTQLVGCRLEAETDSAYIY
jgi:hypothetical protein